MTNHAFFTIDGNVNDFISEKYHDKIFKLEIYQNSSIKDTLEALGIPHPEVAQLIVNEQIVDFEYLLGHGDQVQVFSYNSPADFLRDSLIKAEFPEPVTFIVDVNMGKLAKKLRMAGFDSLYHNKLDDPEIAEISVRESRIILTRDIGLLKRKVVKYGYWVRSTEPDQQLSEVVDRFELGNKLKILRLCLECNHKTIRVNKEDILDLLEPKTKQYFEEFFQCTHCHKVYWNGSHYQSMVSYLKQYQ